MRKWVIFHLSLDGCEIMRVYFSVETFEKHKSGLHVISLLSWRNNWVIQGISFVIFLSWCARREATIFWLCDAPHPLWPVLFSSPSECWLICIWSTGTAGVCGILHGSTEQTRELKARASVHTHVWCSSLWVVWWFRFYDVKIMKCAVNQGPAGCLLKHAWLCHNLKSTFIHKSIFYVEYKGWVFFCDACWISKVVVTKILYKNPLKEKKG